LSLQLPYSSDAIGVRHKLALSRARLITDSAFDIGFLNPDKNLKPGWGALYRNFLFLPVFYIDTLYRSIELLTQLATIYILL